MFTFTDSWTGLNSSLVKAVFYDAPKRQMLVRLDGDKQYIYSNVGRNEAETIANARSKGSEYNFFRRTRGRGNGGSTAHGEVVTPREVAERRVVAQTGPVSVNTGTFTNLGQASSVRSGYVVKYLLNGTEFSSTVEAGDLVAAVNDVDTKLKALGLGAVVVSASRK